MIARVVGVAPAGFDGHSVGHSAEVWLPLWTHPALNASSPIRTDRGGTVTAVAVCIGLSALTTILIGLSPALRFSRPALLASLKEDAGSGKRRSGRIHKIATPVQTAIALPLLIINGMFLQGTRVMSEGDYGFKVENLLVARSISMPKAIRNPQSRASCARHASESMRFPASPQ